MRTKLPLLLLLTVVASSELARAENENQDRDAAVARAEAGPTPGPSRSLDASRAVSGPEAGVHRVISSYGRAIETQDVKLFRSLMPDIGDEAETRLRESFRTIGSQQVDMTIDSIDIDGDTATIRVSREDTIDGRRMKLIAQNFHLVRRSSGWRIQSLSVGQ